MNKIRKIRNKFKIKNHKKCHQFQRSESVNDDNRRGHPKKSGEKNSLVRAAFKQKPQLLNISAKTC